jgi:hypothetical protein
MRSLRMHFARAAPRETTLRIATVAAPAHAYLPAFVHRSMVFQLAVMALVCARIHSSFQVLTEGVLCL